MLISFISHKKIADCSEPVCLYVLKRTSLDKVFEAYPKQKESVMTIAKDRIKQAEDSLQKVEERIRHYYDILRMQKEGGRKTGTNMFTKSLQNDFAFKLNHEIRKVDLFKSCSTQFINSLARNLAPEIYNAGETIFSEGEEGQEMFFISKGSVEIIKGGKIVWTFNEGAFFGEMALIDAQGIRSAGARAKTDLDALTLSKKEFLSVLNEFPNERHAIQRVVEERNKKNEETQLSVKDRINNFYKLMRESSATKSSTDLNVYRAFEMSPHLLEDIAFLLNQQLRKVPLFKDCSQEFISALTKFLKPRIFNSTLNIFTQGTVGTEMFFLITGTVEVVVGGGKVVAELSDGAFFGEGALVMSDGKRNATIRAKTDCDCFVLSKDDLEKVFEEFPQQRVNILSVAQVSIDKIFFLVQLYSYFLLGENIAHCHPVSPGNRDKVCRGDAE